jgi:hypothetical protein
MFTLRHPARLYRSRALLAGLAAALVAGLVLAGSTVAHAGAGGVGPNRYGEIDCNGLSPIQQPVRVTLPCADPVGHGGYRFTDNRHYIGHDEPDVRFISTQPGSGDNVTWTERLGSDPSSLPTVSHPGGDVTHWFELSVAPWFSMALCDPKSDPQIACTPESDTNAPQSVGRFPGGGSAFLELQFYPPGMAPIVTASSCDNSHWCAAMTIDSLECTAGKKCNNNCIEPINFGLIQTNGVPTGPPSPQLADLATFTPDAQTLLMNPGDQIKVQIFDNHAAGALEAKISDLSTGKSGFMIASAANGFMNTNIGNCRGTPFSFQPEYSSASAGNIVPWAALEANILTQFEIGHFTPCTSLSGSGTFTVGSFTDPFATTCHGPYEETASPDPGNPEGSDAPCYPAGDTHGGVAPPNEVTGCPGVIGPFSPSSDLDYDGTSYWPDWPSSTTPGTFPAPFFQQQPTTNGGATYPQMQFETDAPATEASCMPTGQGCAVPPPGAPGNFYPYWTQALVGGQCVWEFGQMTNGNTFGADAQYNGPTARFFGTLASPIMTNPTCP